MTVTDAYTGLRRGELAGLQWIRTYLDENPRIVVDPQFGALHELNGKLVLGPPKTPANARTVHMPPFLATLLAQHRERNPEPRFVSPRHTAGCAGGPASAAEPGVPPWPTTKRELATADWNAWDTSARTSTTTTHTSPTR
ncbi:MULTISPECIES: hypothetical protein [unclassified Crossiella]|uniref:hypothetical protein n=1 Tax=unclassified Crossiella TaxID=2620835 RepID=UPI001FFF6F35|nr:MULTISPECIES: hypothetical protein [unclassified Crossiella]MCK2243736.1 hypothetical protein [Crossiella sp. S99.2]MCK2257595.1 hypothetical protein [Crossiella sp. S99.1]